MSHCHKLWFSNPYIFGTQCHKSLIFQTYIIWSNKSHNLKCQRSTTLKSKKIGIRKLEFVAKTQFLYKKEDIRHLSQYPQFLSFGLILMHTDYRWQNDTVRRMYLLLFARLIYVTYHINFTIRESFIWLTIPFFLI